ncbi:hypothetical protein [Marinifilum sp. D714]|uniref:hypothetical protein n=1 Tax=Marinifilum sp. D714 TaxID=2937523 RepID=UPI0027BE7089|nr:hypothetical protein [Marinifilum sp. D714]MDQ2180850.1 hypothetical protein [Marinifilum sp. D714]
MMDKKVRNFYVFVALVLFFIGFTYFKQFNIESKSNNSDFEPSYKQSYLEGNSVEHLDSISMIYSNFKYGFSMDFPNNWKTDRGTSEHTVIRGVQLDSAISFSINVIELKDMKSQDFNVWDLWDNKRFGMESNYRKMLPKLVNTDICNFSPRKVYVSNRKAIEIKFNYTVREVDMEFEMQSLFYSIYKMPCTYTVGLQVPRVFYDENPQKYNYLINKFVLMKTKD